MKKAVPLKSAEETLDTFYHGRILILQKKRGYRFSLDAPLLADWVKTRKSDNLLELGTGAGVVSLLLSIKPFRHITAVEIQPSLADLALRNININGLEERITVICADLRLFDPGEKFDIVFSNPPYIKRRGGQLSPSDEKSVAKHEVTCDIFDIMKKTRDLLKKEGKAYFVYPEKRRSDFINAMECANLRLRAIRFVQHRKELHPALFLAECNFRASETITFPPLILYDEEGRYTSEAEEIFSGRRSGPSF